MGDTTCYNVYGTETCIQGPENVGPYLLRVVWALAGVSGLFLGLRLYSKLWRQRPLWWDDHFLVAAWVSHNFVGSSIPASPLWGLTQVMASSLS
jgi:hypothetical protein